MAIYDYSPAKSDELSLTEGQLLYVLKRNDDDWWDAVTLMPQPGGGGAFAACRGLIPSDYVEVAHE